MKQKKSKMKQLNIPTALVIIVVFLVVSITSVNVIVVRNFSRKMVELSMDSQLRDFCLHMDENIGRMRDKSDMVKKSVFSAETEKEMLQTLEDLERTSSIYSVFYLRADGILYDGYRSINPGEFDFSEVLNIRGTQFKNNYYTYCAHADKNNPNSVDYVLCVCPDVDENENVEGFFIIGMPVEEMVSDDDFESIEYSASCLMNEDGVIYTGSEYYVSKFAKEGNAYDLLYDYTDQSITSKNKINQMRRYLSVEKTYVISCKGTDGKQIMVRGANIRGAENLYVMAVYDNGTMDSLLMPVMLISFISCLAIVSVMFFIVLLQMMVNYRNTEAIEQIAYTDEVTGGNNMNYFKIKAPELIRTNSENHYVIVRFDIANFRYINEAYGHNSADRILKNISDKFEEIYSNKEMCARINSDQFIALILNDSDTTEKNRLFEKTIGDLAREDGVKYPIRFKKGIYQIRKEDNSIDIIIDHANAARKSLKGDEKILEAMYSENIINDMKKNDAIESQMQNALAQGEFKAFLQPKWDIITDKIVGAEILVRWIKPDGTIIYPSDFVPIFEQNGFVEKLDFYMLEKLCEKIRDVKKTGKYNLVPISINQSRILLGNPEYLKNVEHIMSRYDTALEDIQIEITESVFLNDREKMITVIDQLKEIGLVLCMDDFGSGYSSLNLLKDVPFDILKIDKDFFSEADTSRDTKIILQHIVGMAGELGIKVVCEGVETEKQIGMLKEIGCTIVQGYFYGKPIPFDDFMEKFLRKDSEDEAKTEEKAEEKTEEKAEEKTEEKAEEKAEEKNDGKEEEAKE